MTAAKAERFEDCPTCGAHRVERIAGLGICRQCGSEIRTSPSQSLARTLRGILLLAALFMGILASEALVAFVVSSRPMSLLSGLLLATGILLVLAMSIIAVGTGDIRAGAVITTPGYESFLVWRRIRKEVGTWPIIATGLAFGLALIGLAVLLGAA